MTVVPSPGVRVPVAESLIRDRGRVSEWCDLLGMKLNASKTKNIIVSRSHPLTIGGTVLKESDDHVVLGVTFDSKMTFETIGWYCDLWGLGSSDDRVFTTLSLALPTFFNNNNLTIIITGTFRNSNP